MYIWKNIEFTCMAPISVIDVSIYEWLHFPTTLLSFVSYSIYNTAVKLKKPQV